LGECLNYTFYFLLELEHMDLERPCWETCLVYLTYFQQRTRVHAWRGVKLALFWIIILLLPLAPSLKGFILGKLHLLLLFIVGHIFVHSHAYSIKVEGVG
jgi:hypothetical protein